MKTGDICKCTKPDCGACLVLLTYELESRRDDYEIGDWSTKVLYDFDTELKEDDSECLCYKACLKPYTAYDWLDL